MVPVIKEREHKVVSVQHGDKFSFVTRINGKPVQLTGTVVKVVPSGQARALGLTKSKRRRLGLLLEVEGYDRLFYKDKGQVKLVARVKKEGPEVVVEKHEYGYLDALSDTIPIEGRS